MRFPLFAIFADVRDGIRVFACRTGSEIGHALFGRNEGIGAIFVFQECRLCIILVGVFAIIAIEGVRTYDFAVFEATDIECCQTVHLVVREENTVCALNAGSVEKHKIVFVWAVGLDGSDFGHLAEFGANPAV